MLPVSQSNQYMGAPTTLVKAPNGAIANKKILDGIEKVGWLKPTIEQPAQGMWQFGGYGLAPITIIDTDEGLIAFDTGDSKHDGELLLAAIRIGDQPVPAPQRRGRRPSTWWSDAAPSARCWASTTPRV